jgi:hypothetical protein
MVLSGGNSRTDQVRSGMVYNRLNLDRSSLGRCTAGQSGTGRVPGDARTVYRHPRQICTGRTDHPDACPGRHTDCAAKYAAQCDGSSPEIIKRGIRSTLKKLSVFLSGKRCWTTYSGCRMRICFSCLILLNATSHLR